MPHASTPQWSANLRRRFQSTREALSSFFTSVFRAVVADMMQACSKCSDCIAWGQRACALKPRAALFAPVGNVRWEGLPPHRCWRAPKFCFLPSRSPLVRAWLAPQPATPQNPARTPSLRLLLMAQDRVGRASGERIELHGRVRLECRNRIPPERLGVVTRRLREAETRARAAEAVVARMRLLWLARVPMSNDDREREYEAAF